MAVETIPAATAKQICGKLYSVATMLRGMRMLAASAEEKNDFEALISVIPGLAERAHLILDACLQKMEGAPALGNFDDHDWDEGADSTVPPAPTLQPEAVKGGAA